MKINRIELNNFKSYFESQTFNFKEGLNIISGRVGTGKTSLFEAFQWLLLDDLTQSNRVDEDFILNKKFEHESKLKNVSKIESSIILEVEDENVIYEIKKENIYKLNEDSYSFIERNKSINYKDAKTGNSKLITDNREVEAKLDMLFPEKLRKYLLFKGEALNQLIDFSNPNTLEQAVKQISYLPLFTRMKKINEKILDNTQRKYNNKLSAYTRDKKKSDELNKTIEIKKRDLNKYKELLENSNKEIENLETKEKEYLEKLTFIAGFPQLKEEEANLEYKRKRLIDELENIDEKLKFVYVDKWILSNSHPLLEKAEIELRKFVDWRHDQIVESKEQLELGVPGDHLIRKMIIERKCLICGTSEEDKPDLLSIIEKHLDENKKTLNVLSEEVEDLNEKILDILKNVNNIKNYTKDTEQEIINHINRNKEKEDDIAKVTEELNKIKEKINNLINEKGFQIEHLDHRSISSALNRIKDEISIKRNQQRYYDNQVGELEPEIKSLTKKLEDIVVVDIDVNELSEKKALNYLETIKSLIDNKVKEEKFNLITEIEKEANEIQKNIVQHNKENKLTVVYTQIDKNNYSISFVDKDGNPNPGHGAQETLAKMSLISAVLKLSNEYKKESYPFIVDAPASNFDDTITKPFIESVSKNFEQGIVILKDIHFDLDNYKKEPFTNCIYTLEKVNDTNEESTLINSYTDLKTIK